VAAAVSDDQRDFTMSSDVWAAQDTTPEQIAAALREQLHKRTMEVGGYAPARVLNMVAIVDREWKGEIMNRLDRVGRYHASRAVVGAGEPRRTQLDAWASIAADVEPELGKLAVCHETVEIDVGPQHLEHLDTIVDPVLVDDLVTVVWSPHGHPEAVDSLMSLAHVVLLDSVEEPEVAGALNRVAELGHNAYVVDLAWLRSTPWRERIAATFDPPYMRPALGQISAVTVRHQSESTVAALMLVGWMASRLGWQPSALIGRNGTLSGKARGRRQEVDVRLECRDDMRVPGLAGVTLETAHGMSISLDRGPGGLKATRTLRDGKSSTWTVLGASRGEGGILGEGVRQALLRDPTYRPALDAARALLA
jgi:glucose-6-phosphate dehydrogenase assembly protein OpcA